MKKLGLITFLFLGISQFAFEQKNDLWTAFWQETDSTNLMGFKDQSGKIRIEPRFMGLTAATEFKHVIAVMEETKTGYDSYYLLKNGKQFGRDSLYVWDMMTDIEHEGMIKFRDSKTDLVGFFDSLGKVAIPAVYNDAKSVQNGMVQVIQGAKRMCLDEKKEYDPKHPCEHWSWEGGETKLIDSKNRVLISNFHYTEDLDWYSLKIEDFPASDSTWESFRGVSGMYYNFENQEKAAEQWLNKVLLKDFSQEKMRLLCSEPTMLDVNESAELVKIKTSTWLDLHYADLAAVLAKVVSKELMFLIDVNETDDLFLDPLEKDLFFKNESVDEMRKHQIISIAIVNQHNETKAGLEFIKKGEMYYLSKFFR